MPFFPIQFSAPLADGDKIYIGVEGENPITSILPVYWDAAGTLPAVQPITAYNGMPMRGNTLSRIYTDSAYSISVYSQANALKYYFASVSTPAEEIASSMAGALADIVEALGSEYVSTNGDQSIDGVKEFNDAPIVPSATSSGNPTPLSMFAGGADNTIKIPQPAYPNYPFIIQVFDAVITGTGARTEVVTLNREYPNEHLFAWATDIGAGCVPIGCDATNTTEATVYIPEMHFGTSGTAVQTGETTVSIFSIGV